MDTIRSSLWVFVVVVDPLIIFYFTCYKEITGENQNVGYLTLRRAAPCGTLLDFFCLTISSPTVIPGTCCLLLNTH